MSNQEKIELNYWSTIISRTVMTVLMTLASIVFWDIRNSISEIKVDVKNVSVEMNGVNGRLIKVETTVEALKKAR